MRTERNGIKMRLRDQPTEVGATVARGRNREKNKDPPPRQRTSLPGQAQESQSDAVVEPQGCFCFASLPLITCAQPWLTLLSYEINPYQLRVYHHPPCLPPNNPTRTIAWLLSLFFLLYPPPSPSPPSAAPGCGNILVLVIIVVTGSEERTDSFLFPELY